MRIHVLARLQNKCGSLGWVIYKKKASYFSLSQTQSTEQVFYCGEEGFHNLGLVFLYFNLAQHNQNLLVSFILSSI